METRATRAEIEFLFRRAGLTLPPELIDELHGVYHYIEDFAARVRARGEPEPAHTFAPLERGDAP
jgi:hypothetical protein